MSKKFADCHFHVFDAVEGQPGARYRPGYHAPLQAWRDASSVHGIQRGVLVQTSFQGTNNQRLLQALTNDPAQLRGIAVVAPDDDARRFSDWHAAGVRGIRLNLAGISHDLGRWHHANPMWDAMRALGWHLEIHTDRGRLPEVLRQLPAGIPLVLDHMAKPHSAAAADPTFTAVARRAENSAVHIKLSGAYRLEGQPASQIARRWLQVLGAEHLLWGSDWPCTRHESEANYAALFAQLAHWVGADGLDQVLHHNPERLYWQP